MVVTEPDSNAAVGVSPHQHCRQCGAAIKPVRRKDRRFCSIHCRKEHRRDEARDLERSRGVLAITMGEFQAMDADRLAREVSRRGYLPLMHRPAGDGDLSKDNG